MGTSSVPKKLHNCKRFSTLDFIVLFKITGEKNKKGLHILKRGLAKRGILVWT